MEAQLAGVQRQYAASVLDHAAKRAFHSKRTAVAVADLPKAHGHGGAGLPQLLNVPEAEGLLARAEGLVDTSKVHTLPKAPMETSVQPHWLAVQGSQPATAENAQPRRAAAVPGAVARGRPVAAPPNPTAAPGAAAPPSGAAAAGGGARQGAEAGGLAAGLPLRHSLPEELQLYYDMIRRTLQADGRGTALAARAVAASLASDPGLQPMLPYLVPLIVQEMGRNLGNVRQLRAVLSAAHALLSNPHLQLLPYIHHLLPAVLTCLLARGIGTAAEHWAVREEAAALLGHVTRRSQRHDDELAAALSRVQQSLAAALFDDAPETRFGSLVGLTALGVPVLLATLVPNLRQTCKLLQGDCLTAAQLHVRAALLVALGRCMAWNGGRAAKEIMRLARGTCVEDPLQAVQPMPPGFL